MMNETNDIVAVSSINALLNQSSTPKNNKQTTINTTSDVVDHHIVSVQDVMNNTSPSSSLSNGSSTSSERIGKATIRVDTKNVDGVSHIFLFIYLYIDQF